MPGLHAMRQRPKRTGTNRVKARRLAPVLMLIVLSVYGIWILRAALQTEVHIESTAATSAAAGTSTASA